MTSEIQKYLEASEKMMSSSERKWLMRPFRDGDEEGILELCKAVYPGRQYHREQWMKWWQWMYRDNPSGKGSIWLAEHDGKIVGQYPLIFIQMKVGNEIIKVCENIDLMTHPDYRHQGMFAALERHALDEMGKQGIHITIGFPNEIAYPGHKKSGWFDIDTMRPVLKPLDWRDALRIRISNGFVVMLGALAGNLVGGVFYRGRKTPVVEGLTIAQVSRFDERVDHFWAKVSHQYQIMTVRNREYLNWRYANAPDVEYLIYVAEREAAVSGYLVLRLMQMKQTSVAMIFDILAESGEIAQCLIAEAMERCTQEKVDLVYYASIAGSSVAKAFGRNGFIFVPFVRSLRFCAYSSSSNISKEFLQKPDNWLVQMGDSDMM